MRAVMVEVVAPCRHQNAGMAQAVEQGAQSTGHRACRR